MEKSSSGNSDSSRDNIILGCGTDSSSSAPTININISTTTGGTFSVVVENLITVENFKKIIAKKLKVAKDRICLLHRERELHDGSLKDNGLMDGSKVILIPNVETGLLAQRPENTVMQALESLNDSQVNDFLSGKTPLNLSMRLGDHMMLIQLQLSTVNPSSPTHVPSRTRNVFKTKMSSTTQSSTTANAQTNNGTTQLLNAYEMSTSCNSNRTSRSNSMEIDDNTALIANSSLNASTSSSSSSTLSASPTTIKSNVEQTVDVNNTNQRDMVMIENLKSIVNSLTKMQNNDETNYENDTLLEQSPIKSLSNLVSSPIKTTPIKTIPIATFSPSPSTSNNSMYQSDPISAKLTSCLCKRFDTNSNNSNGCDINCQMRQDILTSSTSTSSLTQEEPTTSTVIQHDSSRYLSPHPSTSSSLTTASESSSSELKSNRSALLHRTTNNPILKLKRRHNTTTSTTTGPTNLRRSKSSDNLRSPSPDIDQSSTLSNGSSLQSSPLSPVSQQSQTESPDTLITGTDTRALAEASRNLTQTLRKLSKEVFTNKVDVSDDSSRNSASGSGAVIESMKNHGKGIYSGTFSGTLNPALQDRYGRPKRDISTVIHILNDLLSATPQYSRGARISFEPTGTRSIKQAPSRRQQSPKDTCKCLTTGSSTCNYGECNGHTLMESNTHGPYCEKHKPADDTLATLITKPQSTISTTTNSRCHCKNATSTMMSSQKFDESSNDSLNTNECQCQFRSFDPTAPEEDLSMIVSSSPSTSSSSSLTNFTSQQHEIIALPQVCVKCNSIELENNKTKNKLEQLRLVMQQKKERREARKLRGAPYGARVVGSQVSTTIQNDVVGANSQQQQQQQQPQQPQQTEVDTAA